MQDMNNRKCGSLGGRRDASATIDKEMASLIKCYLIRALREVREPQHDTVGREF